MKKENELKRNEPKVNESKVNGIRVKDLLEKKGTRIIDVASVEDFKASHIKGAINIPYDASDFLDKCSKVIKEKNQQMVLCGQKSTKAELPKLANSLKEAGYKNVFQYQADPKEWQTSKLNIQQGK